ncbi:MAG: hypothetical protein JW804_03385 [Sedimentisphaerales bacterium]|nr:hypothetical protein [Sedimentisphaerales bacterium]
MIKVNVKILRLTFLAVWLPAGFCFAKYGGGSGTAQDPYMIYTAEQMNEIGTYGDDCDKHFALMADIDLSGYTGDQFNIIGDSEKAFTGVFDGRGYEIYNFTYYSDGDFVGLFGVVDQPAHIKNLGMVDPDVSASLSIGALVGLLNNGTIENCWVVGGVVYGGQRCGALAGSLLSGTVQNCYTNDTFVDSVLDAGGFAGACDAEMRNCFAASPTSSLLGYEGALVGVGTLGSYTSCFWDSTVSSSLTGIGNGPDPSGVIGETTVNMRMASTFINAGWDIITPDNQPQELIWRMCTDDVNYPRLNVEYLQSDFVCPDGVDILDLAMLAEEWQGFIFEIDVDFYPDRRIDFLDWALFASAWQSFEGQPGYDEKYDIAKPYGVIDVKDVAVFVDYWLAKGGLYLNTDIEPYGGDGIVDFYDYAVFSNQYQQDN